MPDFYAVTGVSTGTLIAPFAFLGDEQSIDEIVTLYRNPQEDWVKQRGMLFFLTNNISFAEVPGLEREVRKHITLDMTRRIAKAGAFCVNADFTIKGGQNYDLWVDDVTFLDCK